MVSAGRDASAIRIGVASKVALLLAGAAAALAGQSALAFQVTSNRPFAARCNGPMGAIVIREGVSVMSAEGRAAAVTAAVNNQHNVWTLQRAARPVRLLASRGAIRGPARVQFPRVAVHVTPDDRIILPDLVRAQQTGTPLGQETNQIRFTFQGFDAAQSAALRGYLQTALTVARRVYGPPAFDLDVTVINDKNVQDLQGGYYDVTTNEIHLAPLSGN
ncbi:MAG: hypothetical protein H5T86_13560, partial [Armatimonadetes bacterium]|nr:hypothetical protein [Armatimonadota bacterium]